MGAGGGKRNAKGAFRRVAPCLVEPVYVRADLDVTAGAAARRVRDGKTKPPDSGLASRGGADLEGFNARRC